MRDQAAKLRDLAQTTLKNIKEVPGKTGKAPRIIAVTSGKGGVGKTNVVVNLGIALSTMGHKVIIFDADLGLANVEVLMGVISNYNLYDVIKGDKGIDEILIEGPNGLKLISGGNGLQELANLKKHQQDKLLEGLKIFEDQADFILIDTGAGINKNVLGFVAAADEVIVVVTPEPTSITDAYSLIKVLSKFKVNSEVKLLINRATDEKEAKQTANKIKLVATRFLEIEIKDMGFIPDDLLVGKAVKDQVPFALSFPNSQAASSIKSIAIFLAEGQKVTVKGMNNFISKLMRLFS